MVRRRRKGAGEPGWFTRAARGRGSQGWFHAGRRKVEVKGTETLVPPPQPAPRGGGRTRVGSPAPQGGGRATVGSTLGAESRGEGDRDSSTPSPTRAPQGGGEPGLVRPRRKGAGEPGLVLPWGAGEPRLVWVWLRSRSPSSWCAARSVGLGHSSTATRPLHPTAGCRHRQSSPRATRRRPAA